MFGFWKRRVAARDEPAADTAVERVGGSRHSPQEGPLPRVPASAGPTPRTSAFDVLRDADLAAFYGAGQVQVLDPGQALFRVGDAPAALYLLAKGEILHEDEAGEPFRRHTAGDWIGDLDFNAGEPHSGSATAVDVASVLRLDRAAYDTLEDGLRLRLVTQLQNGHRAGLIELRTRTARLARQNQALAEALFQARTDTDTGFSRSEVVQEVIRKVPRLPVSTTTLLARLFDERTTSSEVVELVKSDPSLTSNLLKAVNSPLYGLQHKIDNLNHAVTLLGFDAVHQVVLSESMRRTLPETPAFLEIYQRSLEVSHLAFTLAQVTGRGRPAEISTIGLLSEIGSVVLELLKTQNPKLRELLANIDAAGLGAELLRAWNLPERLCRSIEFRRHPEFARPARVPADVLDQVALLHLAQRLFLRLHALSDAEGLFTRDYLAALGQGEIGETELLRERVVPKLLTREKTLPRSLAAALSS